MWPLGFPERGRKGRQVFHNQIMVHTHVALVLQTSTTADSIYDAQEIVVRKRKQEREKTFFFFQMEKRYQAASGIQYLVLIHMKKCRTPLFTQSNTEKDM